MVFDREAVWKEALRDGLHRVLADLREPATEVRAHFLRVVASGVTESWQREEGSGLRGRLRGRRSCRERVPEDPPEPGSARNKPRLSPD